ncbi:hypothetical protein HOB30_02535 [Candidatus Falkowbacteria bacterium]|jgi:hypothetical protein|nr:hypothetical protein [Candidatus Falkowbacteria bacterium]
MKQFFDTLVPDISSRNSIHELAVEYINASCTECRDGIIHSVAQKALFDEAKIPDATSFLLTIAGHMPFREKNKSQKSLALILFIQRILPRIQKNANTAQYNKELRNFIIQFFGYSKHLIPGLPDQHQKIAKSYLSNEWNRVIEENNAEDKKNELFVYLLTSLIETSCFEPLIQTRYVEAIPFLVKFPSTASGVSSPDLNFDGLHFRGYHDNLPIRRVHEIDLYQLVLDEDKIDHKIINDLIGDCHLILEMCGKVLNKYQHHSANQEWAKALSSLTTMLLSVLTTTSDK